MTDPAAGAPSPPSPAVAEARRRLLAPGGAAGAADVLAALGEAARRGDGEAAKQLATFAAAGAWGPPDWDAALDHLAAAAAAGSRSAQGQLALLDPGGGGPSRAADRLAPWREPASRRPVIDQPRVRISEGFVTPAVCAWLRGLAHGRLARAKMVEGYDGRPAYTDARTNSDFTFTIFDADCVLTLVRERIGRLVGLPVAHMEPPQVFHYAPGQELRPHVDYLQRGDRRAAAYDGDRVATVLIYLNDDFEGGETWFVRPDLKVKGRAGDAVYFANVRPDGAPDPDSLHAGLPPTRGEKWLLSQWIHDRPFAA